MAESMIVHPWQPSKDELDVGKVSVPVARNVSSASASQDNLSGSFTLFNSDYFIPFTAASGKYIIQLDGLFTLTIVNTGYAANLNSILKFGPGGSFNPTIYAVAGSRLTAISTTRVTSSMWSKGNNYGDMVFDVISQLYGEQLRIEFALAHSQRMPQFSVVYNSTVTIAAAPLV